MYPYFVVFVVGAFSSLVENLGLRRQQNLIVAFQFWLLLALFAGLRGPYVSDDYFNYQALFSRVAQPLGFYLDGGPLPFLIKEPTFFLIMSGAKTLGLDFAYVVFVVAVLATWIVYRSVCLYSPYPLLSLLLYFGHAYLNREMVQIQSGLAIAIVLYAVRFVSEGRALKYHGMIALATTVHVVAFITMPLYFLMRLRYSNRVLLMLLFLALCLAAVDWVHAVLNVGVAAGILPGFVTVYVGWQKHDYALGVLNNLATLKQLVLLAPMFIYRQRLEERFPYFRELFLLYFAGTCWIIATHHMAILAARVATVLTFGEVVLVAMLVTLVRERFPAYCFGAALAVLSLLGNLFVKSAWNDYSLVFG